MSIIAALTAITLTSTEKNTVAATTPFEDVAGMMSHFIAELALIQLQIAYVVGNMPAGANKTAISNAGTALS